MFSLRLFTIVIVIVIVGVFAVKLTAPSAVDHNAQYVVFAQRLKSSRHRIEGCRPDPNHQDCSIAHGRKQVRISREQERRAVENHPIEMIPQSVDQFLALLQVEQFKWIWNRFACCDDVKIGPAHALDDFAETSLCREGNRSFRARNRFGRFCRRWDAGNQNPPAGYVYQPIGPG